MTYIDRGIVDVLKEPDLLADMHMVAERKHLMYAVNHTLVTHLARKAFGLSGEVYTSLGVGVQEVITDFSVPETPQPVVVAGFNTASLLVAPSIRVADMVIDVSEGFRRVEPTMFDIVREVVETHVEEPSSRNLALFGAALSYSMQVGRQTPSTD